MNFLLHHHLARRDLGSPAAAVGAMLPDLWRMADRRVRPRRRPLDLGTVADPPVVDLLAGVDHHLEADRWFHSSGRFQLGVAATRRHLRSAGWTGGKMLLLAHVAWELCLDGALVRRRGAEAIVGELAEGFAGTGPGAWRAAADLHRPPIGGRRFEERLRELAAELLHGSWVRRYADGTGQAACLAGVRRRLGLPSLEAAERRRLTPLFDALLKRADAALDALLREAPRLAPAPATPGPGSPPRPTPRQSGGRPAAAPAGGRGRRAPPPPAGPAGG